MALIDQIKYSKIQHLANVLEDISEELLRRRHDMSDLCKSINGIVTDLRETVGINVPECQEIKEDQIQIKRLECRRKIDAFEFVPTREKEPFEKNARRSIEEELLYHIKKEKLIRVRKSVDDNGIPTFTASLIVGIEKDADIPRQEPQITFMDKLLKYLDEERHI